MNPEKVRARARAKRYYEAHKEKCRERSRAYNRENPEKVRARHLAYYEANREKLKAWRLKYDSAKREARAARAAWQRAYHAKVKAGLPKPPSYIAAAKQRVAADPMRHWKSPPRDAMP